MAAFRYQALDADHRLQKGVMEGDSARQVRQRLRERGLQPLEVEETRAGRGGLSLRPRPRITGGGLVLITRQLATLLRSGMPLDEALAAVVEQERSDRHKSVMLGVRSRVMEGRTLADSMREEPRSFPAYFVATIEAGEHSGRIDAVLERLADYMETRRRMGQRVLVSLIYPALVTTVAVGVVILLLTYVVPEIVRVFQGIGQTLPPLTLGLIAVSEFLQHWGFALGLGLVGLIMAYNRVKGLPAFAARRDRFLLSAPLIGTLRAILNAAQFARTAGLLLQSGVNLLEALRIAAEVMASPTMADEVRRAAQAVREGSRLRDGLKDSPNFPPMVLHMIASGEQSGALGEMLERAADSQERELETYLAVLVGVFEPLLIVVMGGVVLLIVLAILMPIFELNQLVK